MKKKILAALALLLTLCFIVPAVSFAGTDDVTYRVQDLAGLMNESDVNSLRTRINKVADASGIEIVILTISDITEWQFLGADDGPYYESDQLMEFADDAYDYVIDADGESGDGLILVINMDEGNDGDNRGWWISTKGKAIELFTDKNLEYMEYQFKPYLSSGDYYTAFATFIDLCDKVINGESVEPPKEPFDYLPSLVIAIVIGLIGGLIYVSILKGKMKSVAFQKGASSYVVPNSLHVEKSRDNFLYMTVTRTKRQSSSSSGSSTHRSSSGSSHGGRGGSF